MKRFTANELKNILFYQGTLFCENLMESLDHIEHFFAYLTSLRLLNKTKILEQDLKDAFELILYFIENYEKLYGRENLTYN